MIRSKSLSAERWMLSMTGEHLSFKVSVRSGKAGIRISGRALTVADMDVYHQLLNEVLESCRCSAQAFPAAVASWL